MCHACLVKDKGCTTIASSQYELSKALGVSVRFFPLLEGYSKTDLVGRSCLCPIDMKKLGEDAGYAVTAPYEDASRMSDEWIFVKVQPGGRKGVRT
ncbi:hypothetical protein [Acetobacter persici]|uniref:hypothetical protein n=1 Tax=Acetobacter persici TaxID=1076596 RepID=UPI0012FE1C02|nr:hypothetical protein [Acetobacter persici]